MPRTDWKRAIWGVVVGVGTLALPAPARAQLTDAIYDDAKDIIEELLTTEIAHEVAPGIACLSGRRELSPDDPGPVSYAFQSKRYRLEATTHFPKTLQSVYNRQFGRLRGTIGDESAGLAGYLVYQALRAGSLRAGDAKARELLVLAAEQLVKATEDQPTNPTSPPASAPSATTDSPLKFGSMAPEELVACKEAVRAELDRGNAGQPSSYPVEEECKSAEREGAECHLASAVRSGLLQKPAAAQDHLIKTTALVIREVAGTALPASPDLSKKLDAIERQVLFRLRRALAGDQWDPQPLDGVPAGLEALELPARLEEIHATWRSVVNVETGKIDVLAFARAVAAERGALGGLCYGKVVPSCLVLHQLPLIFKRGPSAQASFTKVLNDLKPILVYSARGETSEAAQMAIGYLFQRISRDNLEEVSVHQRFVQSVAGYVLDAADGQPPSETARVAFRKASVEMIQHLGQGSGIRRRYSTLWSGLKIALLPDLALRASWSPSYVNQDSSSARILASANWLNLRFTIRRTEPTYLGVEVSALDPLAPLSELALRKTEKTHYRKVNHLFAGVIAPRVEFLAASPMLSEHLGVSAGISLRTVAPVADVTPRADGEPSYRYAPFWTKDENGRLLLPRFLEFGFAAKYLL